MRATLVFAESDWAEMHATILDGLQQDPPHAVTLLRQQVARATELWMKREEPSAAPG